jgi:vanillate O-demethylase ferredoxin subunit
VQLLLTTHNSINSEIERMAPEFQLRVSDKQQIAIDIVSIELVSNSGGDLPAFTAGAFIELDLGGGNVRQYSLANDPVETHRYVLGVLRDPNSRGVSIALHDRLPVGATLRVRGPFNVFPLDETADYSLLIAGGIGITPILTFAYRLKRLANKFDIHLCTRSADRAAFMTELESHFAEQHHLHVDDGDPRQAFNLAEILKDCPANTHLYVCGPTGFMNSVIEVASTRLNDAQIHREYFDAPVETRQDTAFEIEIKSSGAVYQVPAERNIIEVLHENGIMIPRNCPKGFCGACSVTVESGEVDHRDQVLSDEMRYDMKRMLTCVSRAVSGRLVLDL